MIAIPLSSYNPGNPVKQFLTMAWSAIKIPSNTKQGFSENLKSIFIRQSIKHQRRDVTMQQLSF